MENLPSLPRTLLPYILPSLPRTLLPYILPSLPSRTILYPVKSRLPFRLPEKEPTTDVVNFRFSIETLSTGLVPALLTSTGSSLSNSVESSLFIGVFRALIMVSRTVFLVTSSSCWIYISPSPISRAFFR